VLNHGLIVLRQIFRDQNDFTAKGPMIGRLGQLANWAGLTIFLASPESDFMCGQTLIIDGGWLAYGFLQM
jgi:NAD(P)-dependent dehydrogenase (short-subunit alcohol dehydrogenase family)